MLTSSNSLCFTAEQIDRYDPVELDVSDARTVAQLAQLAREAERWALVLCESRTEVIAKLEGKVYGSSTKRQANDEALPVAPTIGSFSA